MTRISSKGATPAMAQWFTLKAENPEALLFFRMGDFYELFFDDATAAAAALDIALTARGTHAGEPIPMCGVPVAAAPAYLARLIRRGFRVAVAEQTETPRKGRPANKGPLARGVVRVITPGTLTEDELLEPGRSNLLLALALAAPQGKGKGKKAEVSFADTVIGAAWIDVSTGLFETESLTGKGLPALLGRLDPAEILAPAILDLADYEARRAPETVASGADTARQRLANAFDVASIEAFGTFTDEESVAAAMAVEYVQRSQAGKLPRLAHPVPQNESGILGIDPATRASLDILRARDGGEEHTLFSAVNRTVSAAGARMLAEWLAAPLTHAGQIAARQDGWWWLKEDSVRREALRGTLKKAPDIARALGRLSLGRGQPRDLAAMRDGLMVAREAARILTGGNASLPPAIHQAVTRLGGGQALEAELVRALAENLPARLDDGGVIAQGYDVKLDEYRGLRDDSRRLIAGLQAKYAAHYGLNSLKIRHHAQLGYVMEVPVAASAKLKDKPELILRQGTASNARFATEELSTLDARITEAAEKAAQREKELFSKLVAQVLAERSMPVLAQALAVLDVLQSCADLAGNGTWCRPEVTEDCAFALEGCRHPVVEAALPAGTRFTPNTCDLAPQQRVMLLTGPNMAGKSTYLRQTALAVILAQGGFPVPADRVRIGVVDQLFSRVGASDDLARGRSTFMVEMTETAAILNQAGPRSLVVVDEIGRGTATLDGLAIAWAVLEALHSTVRCRAIFATHFHELSRLVDTLPRLSLHTMAVREWRGQIVFLHEVLAGSAKKSWGVHVARLAGVPHAVVDRAGRLLRELERAENTIPEPLPLFDTQKTLPIEPQNTLSKRLMEIDPDSLTPRAALDLLYELRKEAAQEDQAQVAE
ncbi:DNA mismatch repair protein MutS [Acetobacter pomorum]|uniref:DNA mismatch repair protein MutS n=1 Tax=Acetobacter pomorum TaxID=65959 RepID=A0A2G4RC27_9PROT|nr:DNA mismatch repair protein MutS [Acetobacter pomorum]PHY94118.1 DNA mismatch repair protein MutS [Acetobacter pomorum]GBR45390.1 DNA mismatch repair protein MutS [Acetobacter pomorum DSM 11825]